MKILRLLPILLLGGALYGQAPVVTSIQNPASNILPGLPNFGIAQGQIFVIYGSNLGPATLVQPTALPWPTTLSGTAVKFTQAGSSFNAPLIYTSKTQIAGVIPSNVPVNTGAALTTVQVTFNGVVSNPFSTRVVDSNFGISTVNTSGTGTAVVTDPNYNLVTAKNPAGPGKDYVIWGTGLGKANSDDNLATNGDLGTPIHVFVGGVEAIIKYRGRSGAPGLDQINFLMPQGVPAGCYVSLMVQTDTTPVRVSNGPTIPVSNSGGTCSDAHSYSQAAADAALAKNGNVTLAGLSLDGEKNEALSFFLRFTQPQWDNVKADLFPTVSIGSCATFVQVNSSDDEGGGVPPSTGLDAGAALTLTPPVGSAITIPKLQTGVYQGSVPALASGQYKLSNGAGGANVGAFNVSFNGPPAFAWTNSNVTAVPRTGIKLNWTGGDSTSVVEITGFAGGNPIVVNGNPVPSNVGSGFHCYAPASANSFTIPSYILQGLAPVSGGLNGSLKVGLSTLSQTLALPVGDLALAVTNTAPVSVNVAYQ